MAGGLFDQKPGLIDRFWYILSERSKEQKKEHEKEMSKQNQVRGRGKRPGMGASRGY